MPTGPNVQGQEIFGKKCSRLLNKACQIRFDLMHNHEEWKPNIDGPHCMCSPFCPKNVNGCAVQNHFQRQNKPFFDKHWTKFR